MLPAIRQVAGPLGSPRQQLRLFGLLNLLSAAQLIQVGNYDRFCIFAVFRVLIN
eukprot:COSAG02_NODE_63862_length_262_cov_0.631902_1_plen_53_part_01